jgi:hypothetical protein
MLKKVLKAVAKLEARAKNSDAAKLATGSSLTKKLRNAIVDLEGRAKEHNLAADLARDAARQLRQLLKVGAPITNVPVTAPAPAEKNSSVRAKPVKPPHTSESVNKASPVKKAGPGKKATTKAKSPASKNTPTLADAIHHALKSRQDQNAGGVKARQLHAEIQQAGYRFGGNNVENQMNYLHKTLRQHAARFKRATDGTIALT